jgi:hypothetical protein
VLLASIDDQRLLTVATLRPLEMLVPRRFSLREQHRHDGELAERVAGPR